MKDKKLQRIIDKHQHWLKRDVEGWENMRADLSMTELCGVSLSGVNLSGAILTGANLYKADLSNAILIYADLKGANLAFADLYKADLRCADFHEANACMANFTQSDLRGANLYKTILYKTILDQADLRGANIYGTNFRKAIHVPFIPQVCPEKGSFIGYKTASQRVIELEICEDARRSSATGRKCRCDKAKVLSITNLDGSKSYDTEVKSDRDDSFIYKVGEIVEEPNFCEDRFRECAAGIHFFINRQEAVDYYTAKIPTKKKEISSSSED